MTFGILKFPGNSFADDCYHVVTSILKCDAVFISHTDSSSLRCDCIIIPGGYSFGDAPKCGMVAARSKVMDSVQEYASKGGPVIGIGNGFQILVERRILPGKLAINSTGRFISRMAYMRVGNRRTMFTSAFSSDLVMFPAAHGYGRFTADSETIDKIENEGRVLFRYCDQSGRVIEEASPEGSVNNIAAITNDGGNVMGVMPLPERCCEAEMGGTDGINLFKSVLSQFAN